MAFALQGGQIGRRVFRTHVSEFGSDRPSKWAAKDGIAPPTPIPAHDREQLSPLFVGDVSDYHAFCHATTLRDPQVKVVDAPHQRCRSRH